MQYSALPVPTQIAQASILLGNEDALNAFAPNPTFTLAAALGATLTGRVKKGRPSDQLKLTHFDGHSASQQGVCKV
eukprot:scaffold9078_cov129-Cylindrotheca_fusiformis.AAC.3